jgi:hypothetical protein
LGTSLLLPRIGPRPLVPAGFLVAAAGMLWLTRLDVTSTYTSNVLGPLIVVGIGIGIGFALAPAMTASTAGIHPADAGVASALLNTPREGGPDDVAGRPHPRGTDRRPQSSPRAPAAAARRRGPEPPALLSCLWSLWLRAHKTIQGYPFEPTMLV